MTKTSKKSASKTEDGLNPKQEQFCQLYTKGDRDFFGNGTQCYLEVYGWYAEDDKDEKRKISYQSAMANASRLLRNDKIIKRINELLETEGFNEENVDKQHLFLINQHADLKTKLGAIKEFNELKQRIQKKLDITSGGKELKGIIYLPTKNAGMETK
jgi:hypothetical protein